MRRFTIIAVFLAVFLGVAGAGQDQSGPAQTGTVRMVDLGAKSCIPCRMMAPVLEALEKDYRGKASIVFIDVRENPDEAVRYKIRAIPTQIFFDRHGNEVYRHEGFLDRQPIAEILDRLLSEG